MFNFSYYYMRINPLKFSNFLKGPAQSGICILTDHLDTWRFEKEQLRLLGQVYKKFHIFKNCSLGRDIRNRIIFSGDGTVQD